MILIIGIVVDIFILFLLLTYVDIYDTINKKNDEGIPQLQTPMLVLRTSTILI